MTTDKQTAANRLNARNSTGPRTPEGKAVVAMNAVKHGLLSQRLCLADENPQEFEALQNELQTALRPVGMLELVLVEKIAIALWKQKRLVAAESAGIELNRSTRLKANLEKIKKSAGLAFLDADVSEADLQTLTQEDEEQLTWCKQAIEQIGGLESLNLQTIKQRAPLILRQLKDEAADDGNSIEGYVADLDLTDWIFEFKSWCVKELSRLERRPLVQSVALLVQTEKSAPFDNDLLCRYQVAVDGELYRAMEAIRKQQEWRLRSGIVEMDGQPDNP